MSNANTATAEQMQELLEELFPIYRSITGAGNRATLDILSRVVPIKQIEYASGDSVFDWVVPDEYSVRDAWIKNSKGEKVVDFKANNLHLVGYSQPVTAEMSFAELEPRLFYSAELPDSIPYRTYYYKRDWGFCLTLEQYEKLKEEQGLLQVYIDSSFDSDGSMVVGELLIEGASKKEVLISTYICHPSMANDNLSGPIVATYLAKCLQERECLQYSYRFIYVPETIGAIAYSAKNTDALRHIDIGFILTTMGGPGSLGFKESWNQSFWINEFVADKLRAHDESFKRYKFDPHGSDERQYSTPGFRINCPVISKDKFYEYEFYHTSKDDLNYVNGANLEQSYAAVKDIVLSIDELRFYKTLNPFCEVMLSKHDLYPKTGGAYRPDDSSMSDLDLILWLMHLCDGQMPLEKIAERLDVSVKRLESLALVLVENDLLSLENG